MINRQRLILALFILPALALCGCYATVSKSELDDRVMRGYAKSFPDKLIFERSDARYDYYVIVDGLGGATRERYRVPRPDSKTQPMRKTAE